MVGAVPRSVSCCGVSYLVAEIELYFLPQISYFSREGEPEFLTKKIPMYTSGRAGPATRLRANFLCNGTEVGNLIIKGA